MFSCAHILFPFIAYTCDDLYRKLDAINLVSFPDPTSCEEKGLANSGRILSSRSMVRAD